MVDSGNEMSELVAERVAAVRRFNRFHTQKVGALAEGLLKSPFSLTEARLLYELAHRDRPAAAELARDLSLDPGYLSRILRSFEERGLIRREASEADARQSLVSLSEAGRAAFAPLDENSRQDIAAWLGPLVPADQARLVRAMATIETLLSAEPADRSVTLRAHQPGDIGWVTHRQGMLYAEEYGWDETYEALVAEILARFIKEFDPARERAFIAERAGEIVGSVFLVKESDAVAKLRLLYVEPSARGLGLGRRLVEECIRFGRLKGYRTVTLWTNDILVAARHIYETIGFKLVSQGRHKSFGRELVGQTWELTL